MQKNQLSITFDANKEEKIKAIGNYIGMNDYSEIVGYCISRVVEEIESEKAQNVSISKLKGMNAVIERSQMIRFRISKDVYQEEVKSMIRAYTMGKHEISNPESAIFTWLKKGPFGDTVDTRKPWFSFSKSGYSKLVNQIFNGNIDIAESQRFRFGLSVEEYNSIVSNAKNPNNTEWESIIYGACKRYRNSHHSCYSIPSSYSNSLSKQEQVIANENLKKNNISNTELSEDVKKAIRKLPSDMPIHEIMYHLPYGLSTDVEKLAIKTVLKRDLTPEEESFCSGSPF